MRIALPFGTSTCQIEWNFAIARRHWIFLVIRALHRDRLDASEYGKRIHMRLHETKVETRRKSKTLSLWNDAREPKSAPPFLYRSARERSGVRAAVCSLRGRKEEVQMRRTKRTRDQKEGQTGRPERGTHGCHGYRRIPASPRCHGDDGIPWSISLSALFALSLSPLCSHDKPTRSHSRNSVFLALEAPIFSPTTTGESLSRPRSVLPSRRISERGKSKKRETDVEETIRGRVRMRDIWSSAISATPEQFDHLSNASH